MKPEQYAKDDSSEYCHQVAVFMWAAQNVSRLPELDLLFAIKNEEKSGSKIVGGRMKAAGVKAGILDLFLSVARKSFHGMFIEIKKIGGKPSADQIKFAEKVKKEGYYCVFAYGWKEAVIAIEAYLT